MKFISKLFSILLNRSLSFPGPRLHISFLIYTIFICRNEILIISKKMYTHNFEKNIVSIFASSNDNDGYNESDIHVPTAAAQKTNLNTPCTAPLSQSFRQGKSMSGCAGAHNAKCRAEEAGQGKEPQRARDSTVTPTWHERLQYASSYPRRAAPWHV